MTIITNKRGSRNTRPSANIIVKGTKEYYKEYREKNKDNHKEYFKEYRENNKDKINEKNKEYYENNKDKINERRMQKITCECGRTITLGNKTQHEKSKIQIDNCN